ncbi:hypothetical protein JCM9279_003231 [Rhodotorula babjevae]
MTSSTPTARPRSPPLHSRSTLPDHSPSTSLDTASSTSRSPSSLFESPIASSRLGTAGTAFATPASAKSPSLVEPSFERVDRGASLNPPVGFQHLDKGFKKETGAGPRSFEWETFSRSSAGQQQTDGSFIRYERRLGPTEASYYLGSRGDALQGGVNDMYLHIGFKARTSLMTPARVLDAWTEITRRHVLLTSAVRSEDYYDIRFVYDAPSDLAEARAKAAQHLSLVTGKQSKDLLDEYLNGPRFLSDDRLAHLVISTPHHTFAPSETGAAAAVDADAEQEYDLFLLSTHFIGDGMALHSTANELFTLLAGAPSGEGVEARNVEAVLAGRRDEREEVRARGEGSAGDEVAAVERARTLAPAMESKLLLSERWGALGWAAAKVEFENEQSKLIGGHAFPRARLGPRRTIVPTCSWSAADTKKILAACKRHGVTIAHAMFALSNLAHVRSVVDDRRQPELPVMMYSALNVRPSLIKEDPPVDWYHIAIGYFNIILPSFLPRKLSPAAYFWHQCLSVKAQTARAAKSPFLAPRTALMALEREQRSIGFERADDEKRASEARAQLAGLGISGVEGAKEERASGEQESAEEKAVEKVEPEEAAAVAPVDPSARPAAPSTALMGLSMLGNLDGMYKHADFHDLTLHTLTTGSRQRPGALLLFAYTFAGRLWVSLGYDENGFEPGAIERWRTALVAGVDELLLGDDE